MSQPKRWKPSDEIEAHGVRLSLNAWAERLGCPVQTILGRLHRGRSDADAVGQPISKQGGSNRGSTLAAEVLTMEEMARLLDACNDGTTGQRNRALLVLGWRSGIRCAEALALQPKDLDADAHTVRILHGKGNKARTVGLDGQAWAVMQTWIELRQGLTLKPNARLFCTLEGGPICDRYVRSLMARLAKAAGITKHVHYHGLRHTLAFELAAEGVPMNIIQQQLGHSNLAVTSRYIAHLNPAQTISRMKDREWGAGRSTSSTAPAAVPAPGWLDRLRADIGDRLLVFSDTRTQPDQFRAIVLLID